MAGGMSSRLFQKIREELGAAYYVNAEAELYTDHGYLAVSAGIDHSKINAVIETIIEEFKDLIEKSVADKELKRAKEHLIGNLVIGLETSDQLAGFYGAQEIITKKTINPEEAVKKIQKIKSGEIMAVAKDIFQNEKLNLAVIGPFGERKAFENVLKL